MAEDLAAAESFGTWSWDAAAAGFRDPSTPDAPARSLFELSGGAYNVIGSTVRDAANGQIVGNLSTVHGSSLSVGDQGSLFLNNGISTQDINQAGGRSVLQRATITVTIPGDETNAEQRIAGITSLTHFGGGIYTSQGAPSGPTDFERVDLVPDRASLNEPTRFKLPLTVGLYRRATPGETLNRSVAGWITRNAFDAIAARIQGLGGRNYADRAQAISDAIDALGITVEVAPFITYNLGAGR
jgi:hypothetical protein